MSHQYLLALIHWGVAWQCCKVLVKCKFSHFAILYRESLEQNVIDIFTEIVNFTIISTIVAILLMQRAQNVLLAKRVPKVISHNRLFPKYLSRQHPEYFPFFDFSHFSLNKQSSRGNFRSHWIIIKIQKNTQSFALLFLLCCCCLDMFHVY